MSTRSTYVERHRLLQTIANNTAVLGLFASTMFISALLLFSVQPVFAKLILPKLGGTPAVWAVSMCFFQAALLAGYCYAHALNRWLPDRTAAICHLAVCGLAVLALPFGLPEMADPPTGNAYVWLMGVLTVGVGLPFFAVSANAPLLQAWFGRTDHPSAADPYFLYGASNLGSFVALLAYPFLVEPALGLTLQTAVWTTGFLLLVALIAVCGFVTATVSVAPSAAACQLSRIDASPLTWSQRVVWIGLAFVPSGLLVAFSTYVATDIASAPLLWVVPLAMFLATFMLVFCEHPPIPHRLMLALQPVLVCLAMLGLAWPGDYSFLLGIGFGFSAFFVTMMVCHRELYTHRPARESLTEFYLWMSFGGVLGGVFAAILAPQIFNALHELPLLLLAGIACRPGLASALADPAKRRSASMWLLTGAIVAGAVAAVHALGLVSETKAILLTSLLCVAGAALVIVERADRLHEFSIVALVALVLFTLPSGQNMGHSERSFFGVHRVRVIGDGEARTLLHGTTMHGIERLLDSQGRKIEKAVPASYYHPESPMALGIDVARRHSGTSKRLNVGVVGLGAGSMACHAKPNEAWRFYEIDPTVVRIAKDPTMFRFMAQCQPNADIVMGDARLTIAKEPTGRFDYLVIDAFSSDAVPVHLLTREALQLYLDKLSSNGLIALHISNRHLDLLGIASALVASIPRVHGAYVFGRGDGTLYTPGSSVMYVSHSPEVIASAVKQTGAMHPPQSTYRPWTDDRSDILSALWRQTR